MVENGTGSLLLRSLSKVQINYCLCGLRCDVIYFFTAHRAHRWNKNPPSMRPSSLFTPQCFVPLQHSSAPHSRRPVCQRWNEARQDGNPSYICVNSFIFIQYFGDYCFETIDYQKQKMLCERIKLNSLLYNSHTRKSILFPIEVNYRSSVAEPGGQNNLCPPVLIHNGHMALWITAVRTKERVQCWKPWSATSPPSPPPSPLPRVSAVTLHSSHIRCPPDLHH